MAFIQSETTMEIRNETSLYDVEPAADADTAIHLRWVMLDVRPAGQLFLTVDDRINGGVTTVSLSTDMAQSLADYLRDYVQAATHHNSNGGF